MGAAPKFAPADVEQWDEATKWFLARVPMTKDRWLKLTAEARRKAFTVAGVAKADVLHDVSKAIDSAIAKGTTLDDFKKTIGAKLLSEWQGTVKNPAWRLETIYRTNVAASYAAGRWSQMTDPAVAKLRPFGMFDAILDNRVTAECRDLDGTILPWDEWREKGLVPPLHFGCRSGIRSLRKSRAEKMPGWGKAAPDVSAQEGFGLAPNQSEWKPELAKYPPDLGKEVKAALKAAPEPKPMPLPKGAKLIEPSPAPAADRFEIDLPKGKLANAASEVMRSLDTSVALPDTLPTLPIKVGRSGNEEAAFWRSSTTGLPMHIQIRARADHPAISLAHEIGHFLDHHAGGGRFAFDSQGKAMEPVLKAIAASKATADLDKTEAELVAAWRRVGKSGEKAKRLFAYLRNPKEQWARAFSQWLAVRSGSRQMQAEVAEMLKRPAKGRYMAMHWDADDFGAIMEAIDAYMEAKGWARPSK